MCVSIGGNLRRNGRKKEREQVPRETTTALLLTAVTHTRRTQIDKQISGTRQDFRISPLLCNFSKDPSSYFLFRRRRRSLSLSLSSTRVFSCHRSRLLLGFPPPFCPSLLSLLLSPLSRVMSGRCFFPHSLLVRLLLLDTNSRRQNAMAAAGNSFVDLFIGGYLLLILLHIRVRKGGEGRNMREERERERRRYITRLLPRNCQCHRTKREGGEENELSLAFDRSLGFNFFSSLSLSISLFHMCLLKLLSFPPLHSPLFFSCAWP